ncbi:hypothetical protein DL546_004646 [Coniochaeta pulveracea]|uniref:Rhodopsin domain-containing protein n=1 Tax=Coniochaeta pulveracea TaxID=177199 RepID=A0A420YLJ8_9PEZI|nr:hypothetical protein DL546_004646 [Coniochaeta pulveracea]
MSIYTDPPPLRPFREDKPTLLVCWWITLFATVIILLRVGGRFVRSERLFKEDKMAALALIPLYMRIGVVHTVLIYGTNNVQLEGLQLSEEELHKRRVASGLVLLSRILYAATLWILKNTILEFFRRLHVTWRRSYYIGLAIIRGILIATFIAVVIADLAECHPFSHYWQVLPDPGGQCRQGYAQLVTMAVCNVFTDLLLVLFPIPVIVSSGMSLKRKAQLILLFSLSLAPIVVTIYRVPRIMEFQGRQSVRSVYASVEILFATVAANALVLGSFVRDRGVKKNKFKYGSVGANSLAHSSASEGRRPTVNRYWGSLVDLARDTGFGVRPELREADDASMDKEYVPAAPAAPYAENLNTWDFPRHKRQSGRSDESLLEGDTESNRPPTSAAAPRRVSFFDVGGLLDDQPSSRGDSSQSGSDPLAPHSRPSSAVPASGSGFRRGSTAFLQDIGGLLSPLGPAPNYRRSESGTRHSNITEMKPLRGSGSASRSPELEIADPGGLLNT